MICIIQYVILVRPANIVSRLNLCSHFYFTRNVTIIDFAVLFSIFVHWNWIEDYYTKFYLMSRYQNRYKWLNNILNNINRGVFLNFCSSPLDRYLLRASKWKIGCLLHRLGTFSQVFYKNQQQGILCTHQICGKMGSFLSY